MAADALSNCICSRDEEVEAELKRGGCVGAELKHGGRV